MGVKRITHNAHTTDLTMQDKLPCTVSGSVPHMTSHGPNCHIPESRKKTGSQSHSFARKEEMFPRSVIHTLPCPLVQSPS